MTILDTHRGTRRTEGVRTHGRSARIVAKVLKTTAEELGRTGYAAFRVEDVALRSGVNKTTIYRRWPTKVDLVSAALLAFAEPPKPPESGSVRKDLLALLENMVARMSTPLGRGIVRMLQVERADPELEIVTQRLSAEHLRVRHAVVERAIERGELPKGTNVELVTDLVFSPVFRRVHMGKKPVDARYMRAIIDVVLAGVKAGAARR